MKFSCSGTDLSNALKSACAVVKSRNTVPVLECVHVEASEGVLKISASDLDTYVTIKVEADVVESGAALINAKVAKGLIRNGRVTFETDGNALVFQGPSSSARLVTLPVDQFPSLSTEQDAKPTKASVQDILDCMNFAANEELKYYLRGVCVCENHCVGLDGHQVLTVEGGGGDRQIIPREVAALLATIPDATISLSKNMWHAQSGNVSAHGKIIDGVYPDWERVVSHPPTTVTMKADDLRSASAAISPVFSEKVRRLSIEVVDGQVKLSAHGEFGEGQALADCDGSLEPMRINGKYLSDVCAAFSGREISISGTTDRLTILCEGRQATIMGMR